MDGVNVGCSVFNLLFSFRNTLCASFHASEYNSTLFLKVVIIALE